MNKLFSNTNVSLITAIFLFAGCGETNTPINPSPNMPPIATAQSVTMDEDTSKLIILTGSDIDGDILIYTVVTQPTNGILVGTTYTPNPNYVGIDSFTFKANDGQIDSVLATVSITINDVVEPVTCKPLHKTGQITSYHNEDDGALKKGAVRSYTRDAGKEVVTDNVTKLMWQDNESIQKKWITQTNFDAGNYSDISGDTAITYCSTLTLGSFTDWRLPTVEELIYLSDKGRMDPAIDPKFENVVSFNYWSTTAYANNTNQAWFVNFNDGGDYIDNMSTDYNVRCVRNVQ